MGDARHSIIWNFNINYHNGSFHTRKQGDFPHHTTPLLLMMWALTLDPWFLSTIEWRYINFQLCALGWEKRVTDLCIRRIFDFCYCKQWTAMIFYKFTVPELAKIALKVFNKTLKLVAVLPFFSLPSLLYPVPSMLNFPIPLQKILAPCEKAIRCLPNFLSISVRLD